MDESGVDEFRGAAQLLVAGVLRHGLGALRDRVLGELSRQDQTDGGLKGASYERSRE